MAPTGRPQSWTEKAEPFDKKKEQSCRVTETTETAPSSRPCRCRHFGGKMRSAPRFIVGFLIFGTMAFGLFHAAGLSARFCHQKGSSDEQASTGHEVLGLPSTIVAYLPETPEHNIPSESALNAVPSRGALRATLPAGLGLLRQRQVSVSGSEVVSTSPAQPTTETTVQASTTAQPTTETTVQASTTAQPTTEITVETSTAQATTPTTLQTSTTAQATTTAQTGTTITSVETSTTIATSSPTSTTAPSTTDIISTPAPSTTTITSDATASPISTEATSTTAPGTTASPTTTLETHTSTFTSTLPGGGATTLTSVYVVAETESAAAAFTSTASAGGALQTGAAQPRDNVPALQVMIGAVVCGAFLV